MAGIDSNPYYVAPLNPLASLMAGGQAYDQAYKATQEREKQAALADAAKAIQGGNYNDAIARLLAQDPAAAAQLASIQHGREGIGLQQAQLAEAKREHDLVASKPQFMQTTDASGVPQIVRIEPQGAVSVATPPSLTAQAPGAPQVPPGADPKTFRTQLATDLVKNQEEDLKSAQAAAEFQPLIDKAIQAYQKAASAGAIGPNVGSSMFRGTVGRIPLLGQYEEGLRQDYETALAGIKARITAAQNKGQGQVSNFERQLYGAQFPQLTANKPEQQLQYLTQLQAMTNNKIAAGRSLPIAQTPNSQKLLETPNTFVGSKEQDRAPGTVPGQAAAAMAPPTPKTDAEKGEAVRQAKRLIDAGHQPGPIIRKLKEMGIDLGGPE